MIRRWLFLPVAIALLPLCAAAAAAVDSLEAPGRPADPLLLYGPTIDFDVFRKGDRVGYHSVRFAKIGEDLIVSSKFQLEIDILFFTAFRYRYMSVARWRQGHLISLKADVDDDGKLFSVEAERKGERMSVRNTDGVSAAASPLLPTNHWNAEVLSQTQVLNTLTGRINSVRIGARGREKVATERGGVIATRYAYTGELDTEVWYDDAGRWVKMRFKARDGSVIDYVCRRCQGPSAGRAKR